ncbi:NifB/NifX family molybdenum-iron cluster-binding protein [uncultured Mailhella sp.]|uniref:NifB/NifX family molybdenum-iron cluster-binding protein n=1 Tax=uncultured Mailhella sp. TaxID=1981031 RepID=UPI0025D57849|nr:NifB/NifX family molybdenum-iron cluster-binding protein [uncultured Mailhella sp.]
MSEVVLVAVPSDAPAGLNARPSAHFGHCDAYTVARIQDGKILDVSIEYNEGHEQGGCIVPVQALAGKGVKVLIAGGMGMGPLNAMHQMGMQVFYATGFLTVQEVLQAYIDGRLQEFGSANLCRGGCGHHQA